MGGRAGEGGEENEVKNVSLALACVAQLVGALSSKPKGRGFDS